MKKFINGTILAGLIACNIAPAQASIIDIATGLAACNIVQADVMDTIKSKMTKTYNALTNRTAISLYALVTAGACIYAYKVLCPDFIKKSQQYIEDITIRQQDLLKAITQIEESMCINSLYPILVDQYNYLKKYTPSFIEQTNYEIEQAKKIQLILLYIATITGIAGTTSLILQAIQLHKETPEVNPAE